MFNALKSDELLAGVGRVLRSVAGAQGPLEEYQRSQALSAYSVTRLLAAEQKAAAGLLAESKRALLEAVGEDPRAEVRQAAERVGAAGDGIALGDAVVGLLQALDADEPLRARVHRVLAGMIDAEVSALADMPK
jgi:hypothetical protein